LDLGDDATNTRWTEWWPEDGLQEWFNQSNDPVPEVFPRSVWPVKIRGMHML